MAGITRLRVESGAWRFVGTWVERYWPERLAL